MINFPNNDHEQINKNPSFPPFDMELDFTSEDAEKTAIFGEITRQVMAYMDQYGKNYKQNPRMIVMLIKEISKNVKHHGGGKGYIHIETEWMPIIEKLVFHFVVGDFGNGMQQEGVNYESFVRPGHPVDKPGTHGIGGGMIMAYAHSLAMDIVVYDNEHRRVMHGRHKGYNWKPAHRRGGKGVHYVGTTILEEEPENPQLLMKLDFSEDEGELKLFWDKLRNETTAWLEKELGWSFETHHEQMHYFMGQMLGELWKNIQDHAGKKGYFYLEKEYDALLGQDIFHFIVGDSGPGITRVAGSIENFLTEGYSTGNEEQGNHGIGGSSIKEAAQALGMHLVLYDASPDWHIVLHDELHEYNWIPGADKCDPSGGSHFIGSMILPSKEIKKEEIGFERDFDFGNDKQHYLAFVQELFPKINQYFYTVGYGDERIAHFFTKILNEGLKNIWSYGGGKGYIIVRSNKGRIEFAFGDYGPGIKNTTGGYDKYYTEGFSTGHSTGHGGRIMKKYAEDGDIELVLYDNGEKEVVHQSEKRYEWMPEGCDMSKGAHFIGSVTLRK